MTTILVTHDQEEAFALADRIGVMNQGRLLECGRPDDLYARPATRFVATFLGAANLLLGYRSAAGVRFKPPVSAAGLPPREVVAVLRPEEVELGASEERIRANFVAYGEVEEVLFGGAVERLRVRMADDGPVPAAPGRDGPARAGSLLEVSRTLPEQREYPVAPGARVAVGARRTHVLPTPISSFTTVAADPEAAQRLRESPLLATLAGRMQTRVATRLVRGDSAPPGMPVIATGRDSARDAEWLLRHGAAQLLCVPTSAPLPGHVVIHVLDEASRNATLAVAASLLRHVPAEAVYLGIHPAATTESDRAEYMRQLLDARSIAVATHGLDMRTELRFGDLEAELNRELSAAEDSMLVLGSSDPACIRHEWLASLIEGPSERPVLIVRATGADEAPER
jgi:hypothetical protein